MAGDVLYGRRCKVSIALPVRTPGNYSDTMADLFEVEGGDDPASPGLRVRFKITRTLEKEPNTSEVIITNLSESRRKDLQTKGVKLLLEAGYSATGLSRLFVGDVRTVDHTRDGAGHWDTKFRVGDGERSWRYSRASESFAPGTPAITVVRYLANQMGIPLGHTPLDLDLAATFDQGYVVHGAAPAAMDRLIKSLGYTWSTQDGAIQILARGESLVTSIPEIDGSLIIGSPEFGSPEMKGGRPLVKVRTFLLPTRPGGVVFLRSARHTGQLRVKKCTHTGDTAGGEWYTDLEGSIRS